MPMGGGVVVAESLEVVGAESLVARVVGRCSGTEVALVVVLGTLEECCEDCPGASACSQDCVPGSGG